MFYVEKSSEKGYLTISEFVKQLKELVAKNITQVALIGQISNFKFSSSGHCFFKIKDEKETLNAVVFSSVALKINLKTLNLQDGEEVKIFGTVSVYDSGFKINVLSIKKNGLGAMLLALQERKNRLEALGFFKQEHKKKIPKSYQINNVAVITSKTGAVFYDIQKQIELLFPRKIFVFDCLMQGSESAKSICKAVELINQKNDADLIIIARGGGSFEDLMPFNDEELVYQIFNSRIPVVSAVGHETDFTFCDFVADFRCSTPTHAAQLISSPSRGEIYNYMQSKNEIIKSLCFKKLTGSQNLLQNKEYYLRSVFYAKMFDFESAVKHRFNQLSKKSMQFLIKKQQEVSLLQMKFVNCRAVIGVKISKMETFDYKMKDVFLSKIQNLMQKINILELRLQLYSYKKILKSGYFLILDADTDAIIKRDNLLKYNNKKVVFVYLNLNDEVCKKTITLSL